MKKITYLLSLCLMFILGATTANAQTWSPTERATTFSADKYYLIYNTSDKQGKYFLTEDGAKAMPATFGTPNSFTGYTSKNLFKVLDQGDGTYLIQAYNGKYVDDIAANSETGKALTIGEYTNSTTNSWCSQGSYGDDGTTLTANADITSANKVFYIKIGDGSYWNGNPSQLASWGTAHPYAFYEMDETELAKINIYTLKAQIAEYKAIFASLVGSNNPGDYTQANIDAAKSAIATAQAVLDGGVDAECASALTTLNTTMGAITVNPITTGVYRIVSGYPGYFNKQGVRKALYASSESAFKWGTIDENSKPYYWNVTVADGKVTIQNAAYETWINGLSTLNETGSVVTCTSVGSGQFNLDCGGIFHTQGHDDGAGNGGNIVSYGGGSPNTGDSWILEKVDAIPDAAEKAWDLVIAKQSSEYALLKELISGKAADWAATYRDLTGLITDASQITSNSVSTAEGSNGPTAMLLDNNTQTYYHGGYSGELVQDVNYLQVALTEAPGDFCFYIYKRTQNNNNRPTKISVYGSTDGTNFSKIKTFDYDLTLTEANLWGVVEGGSYTTFRFDVEATNGGTKFFTMSEFQMYAVPTEAGEAKTIADNLNAYFNIANMDDINALADALVYTAEAAATALGKANEVITKTGPGYPKADAAERVALENAIALDPSTAGYNKTIIQALDAYMASTNVVFPEGGKVYKLYAKYASKAQQPLYFNGERITAKNEANIADANSMLFVARVVDGKYVFVNVASGKYLVWCDSGDEGKSVSTNAYTDVYDEKNQWIVNQPSTVGKTGEEYFGTFFLAGYGKDGTGYYLTPRWEGEDTDCAFISSGQYAWWYDGAGGNGGKERTPLFTIEEVDYNFNTTTLKQADDAAYASFYSPFAVELPEGVEAYTGAVSGGYLSMTALEGNVVPAGTGVILKSETAATHTLGAALVETAFTGEKGDLQGTISVATTPANTYALSGASGTIGFFPYTAANLPRGKAYLTLDSAIQGLTMNFGGETTGIEGIEAENGTQVIFDLSGRRVQKAQKGLYIINGKKVLVK